MPQEEGSAGEVSKGVGGRLFGCVGSDIMTMWSVKKDPVRKQIIKKKGGSLILSGKKKHDENGVTGCVWFSGVNLLYVGEKKNPLPSPKVGNMFSTFKPLAFFFLGGI